MTTKKENTASGNLSYETVAEHFKEEARSLISDTAIEECLSSEKRRFENAVFLQIPSKKIVGSNTLRHCKDLLRKEQPLPFLYSFLCFLSEASILMLLYGAAVGIWKSFAKGSGFFASFPFLYPLIIVLGITSLRSICHMHLNAILTIPFTSTPPTEAEIKKRKHILNKKYLLSLLLIVILMAMASFAVYYFKRNQTSLINVTTCFLAYACCMVLFGIHNVVYSSHCISFLAIGGMILTKRPKEELEEKTCEYLSLCYLQILSLSHKTREDLTQNPSLENKLKGTVYSRMITGRIYYLLAIIILAISDILCISRLYQTSQPELLVFAVIATLAVLFLITAFASANHIIKQTRQH